MSALAQLGGDDLMTRDIVEVADMYVGDMLESFGAALSQEFTLRVAQLAPDDAAQAEINFGEQLMTLRNLLIEARRRRRAELQPTRNAGGTRALN